MSFLYSLLLEFYNELFHDVCLFSIYRSARLVHLPYLKQLIFNTIVQYNQLNTSKSRKDKLYYNKFTYIDVSSFEDCFCKLSGQQRNYGQEPRTINTLEVT